MANRVVERSALGRVHGLRPTPETHRRGASSCRCATQRGLALVAVLWMVAALTITATGVVYAVRGEVRSVASFREAAVAGALADAGVVLAARELVAARGRDVQLRQYEATIEQQTIRIRAVPLTGLIDLNAAPESLLTDLIAVAGGLDRGQAASLAQRILDWRDPDDQARPAGAENAAYAAARSPFRTRGGPFEAPEDLLQVLGVDFDLFVKLRPLFTVHQRGGGRVSPVAAPVPVLRVLAAGNEQLANAYASARDASGPLADTTRFPAAHVGSAQTSRFLIEAFVPLSNGAFLVSRKILDVASWQDGVPWTTLWSERVVEPRDETGQ
jgi:general secretion pathway protein K